MRPKNLNVETRIIEVYNNNIGQKNTNHKNKNKNHMFNV